MQVKIDTSERFHAITIKEATVSANMTDFLENKLYALLEEPIRNVLLNWAEVEIVEREVLERVIKIQQRFAEKKASLISCAIQPSVKELLRNWDLVDELNQVPTQPEAIDMILMEEIERELDGEL